MSKFFGVVEKEGSHSFSAGRGSPFRDNRQDHLPGIPRPDLPRGPASPRLSKHDTLPPRAPFRRSSSRERIEQSVESSCRAEECIRERSAERRAQDKETQRLRAVSSSQEEQIGRLREDLQRTREECQAATTDVLRLKEALLVSQKSLLRANETVEELGRALKDCRLSQRSLANLKHLQNQLDLLQQANTHLAHQNARLTQQNAQLSAQLAEDKPSEAETAPQREERVAGLELEVRRLREELEVGRGEREGQLEGALAQLERRLHEKEAEVRKLSVQLNFFDRRQYASIDDVRSKKDQEIRDLRQRFMKVSRDLKETRERIDKHDSRKPAKAPCPRKVRSSKLLGAASESEVTFELSSEI